MIILFYIVKFEEIILFDKSLANCSKTPRKKLLACESLAFPSNGLTRDV